MEFILAQIFGAIALILICIGYFLKTKSKFMIIQVIANFFYASAFFVIEAYVGAIITAISLFRCLYLYFSEKKCFKYILHFLPIFFALYITTTIIFYKTPFDIMPLISSIIFTLAYTIKNLQTMRYILIVPNSILVFYNILSTTYTSALLDFIEVLVIIFAIIKFHRHKDNESFEIIKQEKKFFEITKKDKKYKKFLKSRIGNHIEKYIAKQMIDFALSKKQFMKNLNEIEKLTFLDKTPTQNPTINIVIAPPGSGKSIVSKHILKQNPNTVYIDTDLYKNFHPLKDAIIKNCPTYFGHLTGMDCYMYRDHIFNKALNLGYNILIEVAPSTSQGLFNIDLNHLTEKQYEIITHFIAVSKINNLISIHERYENQLKNKYEIPKLTDLNRIIDSFDAIIPLLKDLIKINNVEIYIYKKQQKNIVKINSNKETCLTKFQNLQKDDYNKTLKSIDKRIQTITQQMQQRNAPIKQTKQLQKIIKIINTCRNVQK